MPKVSVIVPVYNAEKTLAKCIESILGQTFTDFELLLVNDGSKDSSGAICDRYAAKDSRIRVFHKENGGVSSARNLGLDNATGEWIAFADSDDLVYPDWLNTYVKHFFSPTNLIIQNVITEDSCGNLDYLYKDVCNCNISIQDFFSAKNKKIFFNGYTPNKCFRHSIISNNAIRFDQKLKIFEDEAFIMSFLALCPSSEIIYDNYAGYHYFIDTSTWYNKYGDTFDTELHIFDVAKRNKMPLDLFINRLIVSLYSQWKNKEESYNPNLNKVIDRVDKNFKNLKGKRKLLFYNLPYIKSKAIRKLIFNIYFRYVKSIID